MPGDSARGNDKDGFVTVVLLSLSGTALSFFAVFALNYQHLETVVTGAACLGFLRLAMSHVESEVYD